MSVTINFTPLPSPSKDIVLSPSEENILTSYKSDPNAIGSLLWDGVSNGRYEKFHPVLRKDGSTMGYFVRGVREIGYTFCCLYSDKANRFFVTHIPFNVAFGGGTEKPSYISIIEPVGNFKLFRQGVKFQRTESISFPCDWVGSELIYRFIDGGNSLLCVSGLGFCVLNISLQSPSVKTLFGNDYKNQVTGAALSPNTRVLAITMCKWSLTDPVAGKELYKNSLQLFDVNTGEKIGNIDLDTSSSMEETKLNFSEDGSVVSLASQEIDIMYKLATATN